MKETKTISTMSISAVFLSLLGGVSVQVDAERPLLEACWMYMLPPGEPDSLAENQANGINESHF